MIGDQSGKRPFVVPALAGSGEPPKGGTTNKKAFIPAKQRMKALSEPRSAHAERAGLILLLTEKLVIQLRVES
jgi:hypothetical protein